MRTRSLIPAALLLCGCGLRHQPVVPEPARGPARDSLFRFDQSRGDTVATRGLADGMLALLAPDAAYLRAGAPPVFGRDAIRVLLNASRAQDRGASWEPLGGGVSNDLLAGYTFGVSAHAGNQSAGQSVRLERYIAYWERSRGQPWRIVAYAEVGGPPSPAGDAGLSSADTTPVERPAPKATLEARASLNTADSAFSDLSYRMGTSFAFSNTVTDDGVMFGTPGLLIGPRAIRESLEARASTTSLTWRPIYASVAASRDLGYTIGEYVSTGRGPSGAVVQRNGKYLTVWRRQRDGTWRFVVDGGNASPARP